jgi:hypothetical protein
MLFNTTFNNISVISWRSILLVEETGEITDLPQVTDKLFHIVFYRLHLTMSWIWTHNLNSFWVVWIVWFDRISYDMIYHYTCFVILICTINVVFIESAMTWYIITLVLSYWFVFIESATTHNRPPQAANNFRQGKNISKRNLINFSLKIKQILKIISWRN